MHCRTFEQVILENLQGVVQLFVSEENSLTTLPKNIVGLIRIPAATYTTGVTVIFGGSGGMPAELVDFW